jgi:membrane protein DedA with SNARE-associated domain
MERLVEFVVDVVLGMRGTVAYVVVGFLSWAEAAFFLGLVTPGEIAMLLGGVLATYGQAELGWMVFAAGFGTVTGNSTGYWLGRRWGPQVMAWDPLDRRLGSQIERTREFLREKGGRAIIIGRFASFLRIFVPFVVGASRMPYPKFLLYDIPTGLGWAALFVVLGFVLGQSWELVREYSGPAAAVIGGLIVLALVLRWVARKVGERQEEIRELVERIYENRAIQWVLTRYGSQVRWVVRRFDPRLVRGLGLTMGFATFLAGLVAAGFVLNQVLTAEGLAVVDVPVLVWFEQVRTDQAVAVAWTIIDAVRLPWVWVTLGVVALAAGLLAGWRAAMRTVLGTLGASAGAWFIDAYVVPTLRGTEFPSVTVATVVALVVHATVALGTRTTWRRAVAAGAAGVFVVAVVAVAALLVHQTAPTGVVLAIAAALTWSSGLEIQSRLQLRVQTRGPSEPGTPREGEPVESVVPAPLGDKDEDAPDAEETAPAGDTEETEMARDGEPEPEPTQAIGAVGDGADGEGEPEPTQAIGAVGDGADEELEPEQTQAIGAVGDGADGEGEPEQTQAIGAVEDAADDDGDESLPQIEPAPEGRPGASHRVRPRETDEE